MGDEEEVYGSSYETENQREEGEEEDDSSSDSGPPPVPSTVVGLYHVKDLLGSGSYSVVHRGVNKETNQEVAVKFEWVKAEKGRRLLAEARFYERFKDCRDVPMVHWAGKQGPYNIMVMDLQGPSLDDRFSVCGRKFTLKTVLMLAEQMIDRIEYVHSRGVLHRDIKPHNFLMGRGDEKHRVFIMDFGLAKRYKDSQTGKHIPCSERSGVTGTVRYASLNVHAGIEPSRRDDLEAIGYVLMHFLRGVLPWQGLKGGSKRTKHEKIRRMKQKTSIEDLCKGYPYEFVCYFKHCRQLQFADRPDYSYLRRLMRDLFTRERFKRDCVYDWTEEAQSSPSSTALVCAPPPLPATDELGQREHRRSSRRHHAPSHGEREPHQHKASHQRRHEVDEASRAQRSRSVDARKAAAGEGERPTRARSRRSGKRHSNSEEKAKQQSQTKSHRQGK